MACSFVPASDSQACALLHVVAEAVDAARAAYRDAEVRVLAAEDPDSQEDAVDAARDAEVVLLEVCDLANEIGMQFDNFYLISLSLEAAGDTVAR